MPNIAENVSVGKPKTAGAIYRAVAGTALPKTASEELDDGFQALGYISEDGLTNGITLDSESIKAWGGDTVLTSQTGMEDTFEFTMIESLNEEVLKAVYGDDNVEVSEDGEISVNVNGEEQVDHSWVIDMIMRNNALKRIVIPQAAMTDMSDITYKDDEVVGYDITITATPDEEGQTHYEYIKPGETADDGGNDGDDGDDGDDGGDTEPRG